MFDNCYLRLGRAPFASCAPLTIPLLSSLYALPDCPAEPLRAAIEAAIEGQPWSESFVVVPEQTSTAVEAMLRHVLLATSDLEPANVNTRALPQEGRACKHLDALLGLWGDNPYVVPSHIACLKDFLECKASDALQSMDLIWDRDDLHYSTLERTVLVHLEAHHGQVGMEDPDYRRLIIDRKAPTAPITSLAGHVQRNLLAPSVDPVIADDSLAVLSVRDSLTECEAAAAIIQRWLAEDQSLNASDIGVILPSDGDYALYLSEVFNKAGLVATSMPAVSQRRNIGAEAVLHFVQCRRRPAPAMALASLYCSPVLCWEPEIGNALAGSVMDGDFSPRDAGEFVGKPAALFALTRSASPSTNGQLKEQLRDFQKLLSEDEALRLDVVRAKAQIQRLVAALDNAQISADPDWDQLIKLASSYQPLPAERGPYYLGGIKVMLSHDVPRGGYRKLLVLGFNDGAYPVSPSGNPFFLDSEITLIGGHVGLALPSQAKQLEKALLLLTRQITAASEQVIFLLSERDRHGATLSPSSSLPLITRMVKGISDPHDFVTPLARAKGTIWDRLIAWMPRTAIQAREALDIPDHYQLGFDLLTVRKKEDGTPKAQSPSRLENLLVSPIAWLLGEIGASHRPWQPEQLDVMLRGSLAHEVFERLFPPGTEHPDDMIIDESAPRILMDRIRALAPFLQGAVWAVERTALETEIIKAAKHWSKVLDSLGAEIVGNEFWLTGSLYDHPVHGKADCLLSLPDGQPIVVDYKKSSSGGRRSRMTKSWDLQVDLYRKMEVRLSEHSDDDVKCVAAALDAWSKAPAVAYHTLNDGGVLVNGVDIMDNDYVEHIRDDIAVNALALIKMRFDALRAGRLSTNSTADEKFFRSSASLGTYALEDSPLVSAFMREDTNPSVSLPDNTND